jgi:hypothetical protein
MDFRPRDDSATRFRGRRRRWSANDCWDLVILVGVGGYILFAAVRRYWL